MPFGVATAMSGIRQSSFQVPSPATYAKAAVATIGIQNNTFGCFSHAIQVSPRILSTMFTAAVCHTGVFEHQAASVFHFVDVKQRNC